MRRLIVLGLVAGLLAGCSTFPGGGREGETATRIIADATCLASVAQAGAKIAVDPTLGFTTAVEVIAAITQISTDTGVQAALVACGETLSFLRADIEGALAMLRNRGNLASDPAPVRAARLKKQQQQITDARAKAGAASIPPDRPVVITVPLR